MNAEGHPERLADLLARGQDSPFFGELRRSASLQRELGTAMSMDALLRFQLGEVRPGADLVTRIRARIEREERGRTAMPHPSMLPTARRRRVWAPPIRTGLSLAAGVLILFGGYLFVGRLGTLGLAPDYAVVSAAREALVHRAGADLPAQVGLGLSMHDTLRTGSGGNLALAYEGEPSTLALHANTELRLGAADGGKRVHVAQGTVHAVVAAQTADAPMAFTTPHAEVLVRGTRLTIEVTAAETQIDLHQGRVEVAGLGTGERAGMVAGESMRVDARRLQRAARTQRVTDGLVALYTFRETHGDLVHDVSGVGEPLHLRILEPGGVAWLSGGGLRVREPSRIFSYKPAEKIVRACRASNELTLEAWIQTWETTQMGPARICALSTAGQGLAMLGTYNLRVHQPTIAGPWYCARLTTAEPSHNEADHILTEPNSVTTELTHLVFARAANGELRFTVNGEDRLWAQGDFNFETSRKIGVRTRAGHFGDWPTQAYLSLAGEPQYPRPWVGNCYLLAVYSRALSHEEIRRNYRAGPREAHRKETLSKSNPAVR